MNKISIPSLTDQGVFEYVRNHLLTQGVKSLQMDEYMSDYYECKYRDAGGLSCAIGCLIDDDNYLPSLEGESASRRPVRDAVAQSIGYLPDCDMVEALQLLHDSEPTNEWESLLAPSLWHFDSHGNYIGRDLP